MFYLVSISIALQLTSAKSKRAREQRAHRHTLTSVDNKPGLGDREGLGPKYVTTSTSSRAYFYTARTCPNLQQDSKPRTRRPLVPASLCSGGRLVACMSPQANASHGGCALTGLASLIQSKTELLLMRHELSAPTPSSAALGSMQAAHMVSVEEEGQPAPAVSCRHELEPFAPRGGGQRPSVFHQ